MEKRGVATGHFWGERNRPLLPRELVRRNPVLATIEMPAELRRRSTTRSVYVSTAGEEEPKPHVSKIESAGGSTLWEVTMPDISEEIRYRPGKTAERHDLKKFCDEVNPAIGSEGYRPEWLHQLFVPRAIPGAARRPRMRRFSGKQVEPLYVFGNDDRQAYQDTSYPWGCVGKIFNSDGFVGSGALVGANLVVTAAHVVPWASIGAGSWSMRFVPAYVNGSSLFGAGVESNVSDVRAINNGNNVSGYDWAICKLYNPVGNTTGWFGYNGWSSDWESQEYWTVLGYPGAVANGEQPSWQGSVDYHDEDGDSNGGEELESNVADLTPGNSGGPMFGTWGTDPRVIGVVSGEEREYRFPTGYEDNNVFASGSGFTSLIAWGRTNWPG